MARTGAVLVLLTALLAAAASAAAEGDPALGERIYRQGLLPSGERLAGTTLGDVALSGPQLSCASCHRRSGYGSTEGAAYVPPVTGPALYREAQLDRAELFRKLYQEVQPARMRAKVRTLTVRPAYDDRALAVALREGRDPTGRVFDPLMPRYTLGDQDLGHLLAYLKTLGAAPDPGVDEQTLYLATVFTGGVPPAARAAVEAVIAAYLKRKNADTHGLLARPNHSPWHHDDFTRSYRTWSLTAWTLTGRPETWGAQLEAYYRQRPVFAVLGGLGQGSWRPIDDFCERLAVPCLFPNTDQPVAATGEGGADYTRYLWPGLAGEAAILGHHLRRQAAGGLPRRVLQVFRPGGRGEVPAAALGAALDGAEGVALEDRPLGAPSGAAAWRTVLDGRRPTTLVLWLEGETLAALDALAESGSEALPAIEEVVLSYGLLGALPEVLPPALVERVRLTYPYALPGEEPPRIYRARAWMRARGIALSHERLQLNTFFAFSVADHALMHLVERFSRDFFIESVEHETENALNPGVFPHLSLGPGQRFASKGSYLLSFLPSDDGGLRPVGEWIVP